MDGHPVPEPMDGDPVPEPGTGRCLKRSLTAAQTLAEIERRLSGAGALAGLPGMDSAGGGRAGP